VILGESKRIARARPLAWAAATSARQKKRSELLYENQSVDQIFGRRDLSGHQFGADDAVHVRESEIAALVVVG
jgi:hypothetical protein